VSETYIDPSSVCSWTLNWGRG